MIGEQVQRNRLGSKESGQLQQLHCCGILSAEPVQGQGPGGIDLAVIPDHVTAGQQVRPAAAKSAVR